MKKIVAFAGAVVAGFLPTVVLAQGNLGNIDTLVTSLGDIVNALIPILFGVGLLTFFIGLIMYMFAAGKGDDDAVSRAKKIMIGGVIALFLMASIYGVIVFFQEALGVNNDASITLPAIGE